ncbi:MAG: hypothetical protein AB7T32_03830 [Dehalococcoidia bacterium]
MSVEMPSQSVAQCAHHWMIERPSAEISRGTCKLCGESRDFQNEPTRALYLSQKRRAALAAGE